MRFLWGVRFRIASSGHLREFEAYGLTLVRSDGELPGLAQFMEDPPVLPPDERVDGIIEHASLIYDEEAARHAERRATASPDEPGLLP